MNSPNHSGRKSVSLWISVVVITVLIAVGVVYTLLPVDNLKAFLGMEDAREAVYSGNSWNNLTVSQKESLAPLEKEWSKFNTAQKRKWLEMAKKMEAMSPEEKQRFQNHIRDWLNLTPEQRRLARQNFLGFKKLNPDKKTEQWQEYQKLPEEKKRALAEKARSKRRLTSLADESGNSKIIEPIKQPEKTTQTIQDETPEYWR